MTGSVYEPEIEPAIWNAVRPFVTSAVAKCVTATPYDANALNNAASRLVSWTWGKAGLPLDQTVVFNRDVIARFIAIGCPGMKPAVRGNLRSQLLRMSEALLDPALVQRRLSPLQPSEPTAPYSRSELIALRSWAGTQSTEARRANAEVLLSLGAGAGLSAIEIGELRVGDILADSLGVQLQVRGDRPRTVPVLREWEESLIERCANLAPERYAFREHHSVFYPNLVTNFVDRSRVVGVRPQSQRLRSTWIVRHLAAATPLVLLLGAAGVESLEALTRYVRFVRPPNSNKGRALLRDPPSDAGDNPG